MQLTEQPLRTPSWKVLEAGQRAQILPALTCDPRPLGGVCFIQAQLVGASSLDERPSSLFSVNSLDSKGGLNL